MGWSAQPLARRETTAMTTSRLALDLAVIGAGGLSVAAGAVQLGASVVLVEKGKMGGDGLNDS
jgi:glycerol-3-phosphate dehydrogenase